MKYYDEHFKEERLKPGTFCTWMSEDKINFITLSPKFSSVLKLIYDKNKSIVFVCCTLDECPGFPVKLKVASDAQAELIRKCFILGDN